MKTPIYYRIYCHFKKLIVSQELKPGVALPTESELISFFKVSRSPVRQALGKLEGEGLIVRHAGRGTFVSKNSDNMRLWLNFSPFAKYFVRDWDKTKCETTFWDDIVPPPHIRDFFATEKNEKVLKVERVRYVNNNPVIFNCIYFSPFFDIKNFLESASDIFSYRMLLMEKFSVEITRIDDVVTAENASAKVAEALQVEEGYALLNTKRYMFGGDMPVMVDIFHANTSIWDYRVSFEKNGDGGVHAIGCK